MEERMIEIGVWELELLKDEKSDLRTKLNELGLRVHYLEDVNKALDQQKLERECIIANLESKLAKKDLENADLITELENSLKNRDKCLYLVSEYHALADKLQKSNTEILLELAKSKKE